MNLLIIIQYITLVRSFINNAVRAKTKEITVNVVTSPIYREEFEKTRPSLYVYLMAIANGMSASFNNSTLARSNGYQISFNLTDKLLEPGLMPGLDLCEGSSTKISSYLDDLNKNDPLSHYIVLIPCPPTAYTELFNSVNAPVPIIDYKINIECARRVATFFELSTVNLFSSFSNALLKTMGAGNDDYNTVQEVPGGDDGFTTSITISDNVINKILNNPCFLNS